MVEITSRCGTYVVLSMLPGPSAPIKLGLPENGLGHS